MLAVGVDPGAWVAASASAPIADYVEAFRTENADARRFDEFMFGGSPEEVPERYARANPKTYAGGITAAIQIIAGAHDDGCTVTQVRSFVDSFMAGRRAGDLEYHECGMGHSPNSEGVRRTHEEMVINFLESRLQSASRSIDKFGLVVHDRSELEPTMQAISAATTLPPTK